MLIDFLKSKKIIFLGIFLLFLNRLAAVVNFSNATSTLAITGTASQLILANPITVNGILKIPNYTAGTSITQTATTNIITYGADGSNLFNGLPTAVTGSYSPSGSSSLTLTGTQTLTFGSSSIIAEAVAISGTGNVINGSPIFTQPITLADSSTSVTMSITGKLASNIVLNSGTLNLGQDLWLKDDVTIIGPGTINCNGYSVVLPVVTSGAFNTNLTFINANDITVNARTNLTSTWTFGGATNNLKGTGVILNLTGGGTIAINNGTSLYANGVHIKGLGASGGGNITFGNANSKMYLTNCTIELAGNYTQTQGQMIVEGTTCKIITDNTEKYTVSGATTILTVDGQILEYLSINSLSTYPFATASSGTITKLNGGDIRALVSPGAAANFVANIASGSGNNTTDSTIDLSSGSTLTFANATPASAKTMVFDGANNSVIFGEGATQPFIVNENVTLTVQNVKFQNFDPAKVLLQGAGGTLAVVNFADGVVLEFAKSLNIAAGALNFTGNATIQGLGSGCSLTVAAQGIKLTGANKTLTIRNCRIKNATYNSIKLNTATAKLSLQAMDFYMTATGFTFDTGNLEFKDTVNFFGASETTPEGVTTFSLTTAGIATILSASALKLNPDTKILYTPNITGDGGVVAVQKRHFKTTDPSSILQIQHATIDSGSTGMAFDYGKLIIEELATITTPYVAGKEFELGSSVNTTILSSGILNVNGLIKYVSTTYP